MTTIAALLTHVSAPWASVYNNSKVVVLIVTFMHFTGLLLAGGAAVAFDRTTLRFARGSAEQRRVHLAELAAVHRLVVGGLVLIAVSGVLMLAADFNTFLVSKVFWIKMALITVLLSNGFVMTRAEQALRAAPDGDWRRLRLTARLSLFMWFAVLFLGTAMASVA